MTIRDETDILSNKVIPLLTISTNEFSRSDCCLMVSLKGEPSELVIVSSISNVQLREETVRMD